MQSIELQAKSVEEAKQVASEKLGVDPGQIVVTVLEETTGLFGKSTVRVRAEVASEEPTTLEPAPSEAPPAEAKAKKPRTPRKQAKAEPPAEAAEPLAQTVAEGAPAGDAVGDDEGDAAPEVVATEADAKVVEAMVAEVLKLSDLQARARVTNLNGRYVNIELDGKDSAYLVGKHGEVLNALQYLLNVMANRQLANGVRVTLDANHYRQRREEALCKLAVQIAEQVRERGEEAVLDALPAFERRVVHKALQGFEGVSTYSEGEEPNRRVVIAPAG